jgi:endonuclease YncB( thermonuclease family)
VVLLSIVIAIFAKEGLGLDVPWAPPTTVRSGSRSASGPAVSGGGPFTLCSERRQAACVVDGDTIHYAGLKIRLEDIGAPETYQYKCASERALGQRATNRLLELINAGPFELVNRGDRDEDRYGRKLRTIERNGRSVGEILVAEGLARHSDGARRSWCG